MKKVLSLMFVLMLSMLLVACGGGDTEEAGSGSDSSDDDGEVVQEESSGDENTLSVWCWDPAFNIYAMEEAEKVYQKTNPDFKLDIIENPWEDLQAKITTAATAGDLSTLPDIFLMQDNAFRKNHANFPEVFTDLTDSGIEFESFASAKLEMSTVDGKNYGVPFDNGTVVNAMRTDVLEEAGYTIEDFTDITWDEYIDMGKDILEKTGKPILSQQAGAPDLVTSMLQSCGSSLFNEDGTVNIVGNDALVEAIEVYTTMVTEGILVEVNDWDQYIGSFVNGTVAGTINGCWILASVQTAEDQSGNWALTNLPALNDIPNTTNYSNNGGSSWAISTNCKNSDLAIDFMSKTFAGSVELYETILPSSGALATYLPAGESEVYAQPIEFFGGQTIYTDITDYASEVPSNVTGVYHYEGRDAIGTAMTNIVAGADLEDELANAEETVKFQMGE